MRHLGYWAGVRSNRPRSHRALLRTLPLSRNDAGPDEGLGRNRKTIAIDRDRPERRRAHRWLLAKISELAAHSARSLCHWGSLVDSEFFKERAAHCRALAERADPFIKHRLLDLAARYDGRFTKRPSIASIMLDEYLQQAKTPRPE
jgi:hypothetical protein